MCRRAGAAPLVAWFSVPRAGFRFVVGDPTRYRSSGKATRAFCPGCGTQLTFEHGDFADEVDVTTCSLDDPNAVPPKDHTHTGRRLRWVRMADGLPEYRDARSEG